MSDDARYYTLLEQLIHEMTSPGAFDVDAIFGVLSKLCVLLRVSRGVTTFYQNREQEFTGKGEAFVCYDSGEPSHRVKQLRSEGTAQMVIVCEVFQAEGAAPFDEAENQRVDLIMRMIVSYVNRDRLQNIVERMAYWDTDGYHNLRHFMRELNRQGAQGLLKGKAALRLNLKHFSLINQQIGRRLGDHVMRQYVRQLERALGPGGFLGRLGGDNFVAVCDGENLRDTLACIAGRSIPFEQNIGPDGEPFTSMISVSALAGVYKLDKDYQFRGTGDIMDKMMSAYQTAKGGQKGDVVFYSDDLMLAKEHVMLVQQRFAQGLRDEEFLVYYQPKVDVRNREIIGAEALCRWMHEGRLIPPNEFIPVLERGYDICKLDFYMLEHVCKDIMRWLNQGREIVRVSVNLSRRHMNDPQLFEHIVGIVDRNRVPHEYIEIELTETTTDVEFKDLKRVVSQLQSVGINASVDDFGVGYSSLNLIKEIPWDVLKLDRSLLPDEEKKERGSQMFRHIVAMAHEIGLKCVAEGVETTEQMQLLKDYGCNIAQGFFFDRPLPVGEFEKRLEKGAY